jgi:hypothetical protein
LTLRLLVIRVMLLSLLAAGLLTAAFVLIDLQGDLLGRSIGSCVVVIVSCGLLLPTLPRTEQISFTPVVLGVMAVIILLAALSLLLIWIPSGIIREDATLLLMFLIALTFPALGVPLRFAGSANRQTRTFALGALLLICGAACGPAVAVGAVILHWTSYASLERATGMWIVLTGSACNLAACACGLLPSRSFTVRVASALGIALVCAAGLQWARIVLQNLANDNHSLQIASLLSFPAGALAILGATSALALGLLERRLVLGIIALLLIAGAISHWALDAQSTLAGQDLPWRLLAADLTIAGCLAIAVGVIARVGIKRSNRSLLIEFAEILCPRCGKHGCFARGGDSCKHCGFRIVVAFEDVQCPQCKHDVTHLEGADVCPECGTRLERFAPQHVLNSPADHALRGAQPT